MDKITRYLIIIWLFTLPLYAQQGSGVYNYPVKPGSPKWKALDNHIEKIKVCRIPDSLLVHMSTKDIVETCLRYPLIREISFFYPLKRGIQIVSSSFNGLKELLQRPDAAKELSEKYKAINPALYDTTWPMEKRLDFYDDILTTEALLGQKELISQLLPIERKELLIECRKKIQAKKSKTHIFDNGTSLLPVVTIAGQIMLLEGYEPLITQMDANENIKRLLDGRFLIKKDNAPDPITVLTRLMEDFLK
jgi:hypothetical protein